MEQRAASRISFNYNKGRVEPSNLINNYNTTNYIVEKYIVQPQEMNIKILPSGAIKLTPSLMKPRAVIFLLALSKTEETTIFRLDRTRKKLW